MRRHSRATGPTPATVVLVPPDACELEHSEAAAGAYWVRPPGADRALAERVGATFTCKTTLHTNGRPTLCECGQVLYKMDPTMVEYYADGETVA